MQIKPPPEWLGDWAQLLAVQLVALGGLLIGGWKLLMKPFKKRDDEIEARTKRVYRAFKRESFRLRTKATTIMGMAAKNERNLERMDQRMTALDDSVVDLFEELKRQMREIHDDTKACRTSQQDMSERLARVETKLNINP